MSEKINDVVEKASMSFWATVAEHFPEIKSGDLSIEMTLEIQEVMQRAVTEWVDTNSTE